MPGFMTEQSCRSFSGELASKAPIPGGGAAAAFIGSLAAALGGMAVKLTAGKKKFLLYEEDHKRITSELEALRLRFLDLVEEDAAAFEPLSRAYSMDKTDPVYAEILRKETLAAAKAPLDMMHCSSSLITLLKELSEKCSPLLLSDIGCAAVAARAALESAAMNVFVNTRCLQGDTEAQMLAEKAEEILKRDVPQAQTVADSVMSFLKTSNE